MSASAVCAALVVAVERNEVNPGLLGFTVVALLGVATFLLVRSMNSRLRRIDLPAEPVQDRAPVEREEQEPPGPSPQQPV